jgi:serpin B
MAKTLSLSALPQDKINVANAALLPALMSDPSVQVSVANALWANAGLAFSPAFEADAKQFYRAQATTIDFNSPSAAGTINGWVRKNTQGRIPQIVTPDDLKYATNILTNAVYFHGEWQTPFETVNTIIKPFHLPGGGTKPVPLMQNTSEVAYSETPQFQAAALPYGTGRIAMVILLPKPSVSVETLALSLTGETTAHWLAAMPTTDIQLYLPRFKADMTASLGDPLSTLGMSLAFKDDADFDRMTSRRTKLSAVLHVATLDVDEQGTVAAAATGVAAMAGAMPMAPPPPPPVMRVDRPFIVLIRDTETGSLLFAGVIRDPQ